MFSLSSDAHNEYLAQEYANQETKVVFTPDFPMQLLHTSWQIVPNDKGGFSRHFANDIYTKYEGFVEYEEEFKQNIAKNIVDVFGKLLNKQPHIVDRYQFIDLLVQFVIHAKEPKFYQEREYRISLVSLAEGSRQLEETRGNAERETNFIRLNTTAEIKVLELR